MGMQKSGSAVEEAALWGRMTPGATGRNVWGSGSNWWCCNPGSLFVRYDVCSFPRYSAFLSLCLPFPSACWTWPSLALPFPSIKVHILCMHCRELEMTGPCCGWQQGDWWPLAMQCQRHPPVSVCSKVQATWVEQSSVCGQRRDEEP